MSPAGGLFGPPSARFVAAEDALPPGLAPQPPQQGGVDRDGADWDNFSNPCLRLFLADRSTPPQRLRDLLAAAWEHDADVTLKLICQMRDRDVDATGKGDKESFYTAALWLHKEHPRTLCYNLSAFAELGYIKDMPELLYRLVKGANVRELEKAKAQAWWSSQAEAKAKEATEADAPTLTRLAGRKRSRTDGDDPAPPSSPLRPLVVAVRTKPIKPDVVVPADEAEEIQADDEPKAAVKRPMTKRLTEVAITAAQALSMYKNDESYKRLYDCVAEFFSERLKSDLAQLRANPKNKIGLAAKWCPSLDSGFDKATLLCEGIARRLFPFEETNNEDVDRKTTHEALCKLRRHVLVPLRKALQLPELYISSNRWSELPYEHVAQLAMKRYKPHFLKHDEVRFTQFMDMREDRRARNPPRYKPTKFSEESLIEDGYNILPHTMVSANFTIFHRYTWHALVKDLKRKKTFHNCVAVLDLSNSMKGKRRHVCLAIGLLLAEVGFDAGSWKNTVRPFGMKPRPNRITRPTESERIADLDNLLDRMEKLNKLQSQCSDKMDLRSVFSDILDAGRQLGVKKSEMVRTIIVITNKDFDEAIACPWRNDYKAMCELFTEAGFGSAVPQVVFWNLEGEHSATLTESKDGVMKVSGFSDNLFKLFLRNGGIVTPEDEMHGTIELDAYKGPIVID